MPQCPHRERFSTDTAGHSRAPHTFRLSTKWGYRIASRRARCRGPIHLIDGARLAFYFVDQTRPSFLSLSGDFHFPYLKTERNGEEESGRATLSITPDELNMFNTQQTDMAGPAFPAARLGDGVRCAESVSIS